MTKERVATKDLQEIDSLARTLLILANYEWIQEQAEAVGVFIVPLKGIDLLHSLYAERFDRHVTDIDILCRTEEDCRKLVDQLCQEEYRLEFPFALQPEALAAKKKVSLLSCNISKVNVDIHTAFVTKKFFSQTIGTFNADALERCSDGSMEALDRWLFLAQHATFHGYSDSKWTKDLRLLYDRLSEADRQVLVQRADEYGFRRVVIGALYHTQKEQPEFMHQELARLRLTSAERRFLYFVKHFDRPFSRSFVDRLVTAYWEFVSIAKKQDRMTAWLHLLFPSKGLLTNIYRIKHTSGVILFYPLNILISGLSSALFGLLYTFVCIRKAVGR